MNPKVVAGYLFVVAVTVFFLAPFVWLFLSSVDPRASLDFAIPASLTAKHYLDVFTGRTLRWIVNSTVISIVSATLDTLLAVLAAYSLTRYRFRGQGALVNMFMILRLMPAMVVLIPIIVAFARVGLLNTHLGVILVISALTLPFSVMIASNYLETMPTEYEEAAMVEGCTRFMAFMRITVPLALPGLATIWILSFVVAWGEFLVPLLLLRSPDLYPVSVGIYMVFGEHGSVNYGMLSALSVVYSLPVVAAFVVTKKYLTRGISGLVTR